jgi:hypothetical protein
MMMMMIKREKHRNEAYQNFSPRERDVMKFLSLSRLCKYHSPLSISPKEISTESQKHCWLIFVLNE